MSPSLSALIMSECLSGGPLPRVKPSPIPPLHPVPEIAARGELHKNYEDTKAILQVPWMGVVSMAFAHYPRFYDTLWRGLRPLCASQQFEDACRVLRSKVERSVARLEHRALEQDLLDTGYASQEIDQVRDLIEVFAKGNMPYLLMATLARLLLEGRQLSSRRLVRPGQTEPQADHPAPLILMEQHHGNAQIQALYEEIKSTLGLPFINTDYRALARWPSYFSMAWQDLRPLIQSTQYEPLVTDIHATAMELALDLPNPGMLTPEQLQQTAREDGNLEEVRDVVRLFQYLLPGLVTNIAVLRAQLLDQASAGDLLQPSIKEQ